MALSQNARRHVQVMATNPAIGDEISDMIDAGSGTLSARAKEAFRAQIGIRAIADSIIGKIESAAALTGDEQSRLGMALGSRVIAEEISDVLSA